MTITKNTKDSELKQVLNFLKYGDKGNMVWRDENNRCVKRISGESTTLPACELYENWDAATGKGNLIGETLLYNAVRFLYDETYELIQ